MQSDRRSVLKLLGALAAGLAAGCGPAPIPTPTAQPVPTTTPTPEPPKIVRIGVSREPETLVGLPGASYPTAVVGNLLFSVLVGVDDRMQPYPDLAESLATIENGGAKWVGDGASRQLQTTFRLRRGATWSDGRPLTSRDVRFTRELLLNPFLGASADLEAKYDRVETPDDYTVVFTMHSEASARAAYTRDPDTYYDLRGQQGPVVDPLYLFGVNGAWVLPEHVVGPLVDGQPRTSPKAADLLTKSAFARQPVGSGPYTLREWRPGVALTFAARRDYHRGAPKVQTVVVSFPGTGSTAGTAGTGSAQSSVDRLRGGQLDVVTSDALDVTAAPLLDALPAGLRAYYAPGASWEHLDLNLDDPILKDPNVRKALYHAVDRRALVDQAISGKGSPLRSVLLDWSWAYAADAPDYPYDPDRARQLLGAAGWQESADGVRTKAGARLALKYVSTDWPVRVKVASLLKAQLRKVGVDLAVEHVPSDTLLKPQMGRLARRTFQAAEYAWVNGFDPGADLRYLFGSGSVPSRENNNRGGNYAGYRSTEADRLIAAALATLDRAERTRLYGELQRLILEDLPTLPLFAIPNVCAATERLVGFRPGIGAIGETWNAHEWDLR